MVQRGPKLKLIQKEPQLKTVSIGVEFKAPYGATYSEIRLNQLLNQKGKNLTLLELCEKNFSLAPLGMKYQPKERIVMRI